MIPVNAFAPASSRESFLETLGAGDALRRLHDGLGAREPFLLLVGDPGTGKTALAREAGARWESRVAMASLACPGLLGAELLEAIVLRFGGTPPEGASRPKLMSLLERSLADIAGHGKTAMLVVDDAHTLAPELLEELRLLSNAAQQAGLALEILLVGLPALESALEDPALAALRQRVSVRVKLEPLSAGETRRYLRHRVSAAGGDGSTLFPRLVCTEIATLTRGVPRQINALAGEAVRLAVAGQRAAVSGEDVQAAAAALWGAIPSGVARLVADEEVESPPAAVAHAAALAKAPAPVPIAAAPAPRTSTAAPAPARPAPAPAPVAPVPVARVPEPVAKPIAEARVAPRVEEVEPPKPAPIVSQDPREWVSRFVGEGGFPQIGSRVNSAPSWEPEPFEPRVEEAAVVAEVPKSRKPEKAAVVSRSRPAFGGLARLATSASLVGVVVLCVAGLLIRAGGLAKKHAAPVDTTSMTASIAAPEVVVRPASPAPAPSIEKPRQRKQEVVSPTGHYTIDVGGASELQRAMDERDRVQALTGIQGWIVPAPDGAAGYRIVLGNFSSLSRANGAANMLVRSRTLGRAVVVGLPQKSVRQ